MNDYQARTFEQYEQSRMAKLVAMAAVVAGFTRRDEPKAPKRTAVRLPKRPVVRLPKPPKPPKAVRVISPTIIDSEGRAYLTRRAAAAAWMVHENMIYRSIAFGASCQGLTFRRWDAKRDRGAAVVLPGTVLATTKAKRGNRYATEQERIEARRASRREWMRRYRQNADSSALQPRRAISTPEPTQTPSDGEETRQTGGKRERNTPCS